MRFQAGELLQAKISYLKFSRWLDCIPLTGAPNSKKCEPVGIFISDMIYFNKSFVRVNSVAV